MKYHDGRFLLTYTSAAGRVETMDLPEEWAARLYLSLAESFAEAGRLRFAGVHAEERAKM